MNKRHPGRPKKTDYGTCKVTGCPNTTENGAFGLCRTHYMANRRGQIDREGQPLYEPKRVRSYGPGSRCIAPECLNRPKGRGLCTTHYQQWEAGAELGVEVPDRGFDKTASTYTGVPCLVLGCLNRPVNKGMCRRHTGQRQAGIIDARGISVRDPLPMGRKRERESWIASDRDGYVVCVAPSEHPHARADGTILVHRLVMEQQLGRYLEEWEIVHHKNGIRADNRPENLELMDGRAGKGPGHPPSHFFDTRTAAQVILQEVKDKMPEAVIAFLEGIMNKGQN